MNTNLRFHLCGTVLVLLLISACKKKESVLGTNILSDEEKIGMLNTDTFTLVTYTEKIDSIPSDENLFNMLGCYNDPDFGKTTAGICLQFQPSTSTVDFGNVSEIEIDSVVLSMVYVGYYGKQDAQQFDVHELSEDIDKAETYYSNRTFQTATENIIDKPVYIPSYSGIPPATGEAPEQLRIKLKPSFGKSLIEFTSQTTDIPSFLTQFKGIYIKPSDMFVENQAVGNGAILVFNMLNDHSKLTVYFHNTQDNIANSYDYLPDNTLARINTFSHNYQGTPVENALNNPEAGEQLLYIQAMSGVAARVNIPHLTDLVKENRVSINKAELIVTLQDGTTSVYAPDPNLSVEALTASGIYTPTIDQAIEGNIHFGGDLNSDGQYIFNISREVQYILNNHIKGNEYNLGYRIISPDPEIGTARTILKGSGTSTGQVRLIVSYTPI